MEYTLPNAVVREQDLAGKNAIVTYAAPFTYLPSCGMTDATLYNGCP